MSRTRQMLVNLVLVLSLLLPGLVSAAPTPAGSTQIGSAAPTAQPGDEAQTELAGKRAKRKRERRQDRRQHERKADRKHDRKQDKRKHHRKRQDRKRSRQAREIPTGVLPGADTVAPPPGDPISADDRYIVLLREGAGDELRATEAIAAGLDGIVPTHVYRYVFPGFAAVIPRAKLAAVRADPRVRAVVPDRVVHAFAQETPTGISRIDATSNPTADIDNVDERVDVDVAVVDTAGNDTHEDLNIWAWANCTPSHNHSDDDDHGTHVGGTIGGLDNNDGVVGVAPGARLWNLRVLVNGSGLDSWIICGLDLVTQYATDQGDGYGDLEVANLSLGGDGSDSNCATDLTDLFHQAFCRAVAAGVTVVVAAGNDAVDAATQTPAAYDEVITVSALADSDGEPGGLGPDTTDDQGPDDTLATFSNFGADVDIAAPGVDIRSTVRGGYAEFSGTSMASPHVAGAAALYLVNNPGTSPEQVKLALQAASETGTLPEGVLNVGGGFGVTVAAPGTDHSSAAVAPQSAATATDEGKRGKRHGKAKTAQREHDAKRGRQRHRR